LTLKEKKAALEEQKKLQAEARKLAKSLKQLNLMMTSLKTLLLDNKMEDESISKEFLAITVYEAKNLIR
jgi:exosome complex RNA-binding protein Rrp42 (RNase PH superfamily)